MLKEGLIVNTKESNGEVVNYKVHYQCQKNAYTASQIDRSLTAAHIAETCEKVWRQNAIEEAKLYMQEYTRQHPEVQFVEAEDHSEETEMFARSDRETRASYDDKHEDGNTIHHHYQFGFFKCDFSLKRVIESLLDSEIKQAITEEKRSADDDYREILNKNFDFDSTFEVAAMLFIEYVEGAKSMSESMGGGGSSCTSGWGKKDDDEEEWARKCARQAVKMCKPQMVKHAIAKPKGRGR